MAATVELEAQRRQEVGSQAVRRLRRKGLVPAILYGHKEESVPLTLSAELLRDALRHGARLIDLKADGKPEKALIREVQYDHMGKEILHVDFARVSADERIVVTVPLQIRGTAPGVTAGGLLEQPLHTLSVECLAFAIPESIRVNVGELQMDGIIHVRDLALPEGVKAMTDPDAIVVHVVKKVEAEAAPATEAPTSAEPEIIGRKVAEEEAE